MNNTNRKLHRSGNCGNAFLVRTRRPACALRQPSHAAKWKKSHAEHFCLLGRGMLADGQFRLRHLPDAEELSRLVNCEFICDDLALRGELRSRRDPIDHVSR
jgi:hypothetical protein